MRRIQNIIRSLELGGWCLVLSVCCLASFTGCKNERVSDDPSLILRFSQDTVRFDTVFTTIGSATKSVIVHNDNPNAVIISSVTQAVQRYFHINFDGENDPSQLRQLRINGQDSLILFINVNIDPQDKNSPVLVQDELVFETNGNTQTLYLEAYGQDVEKIQSKTRKTTMEDYTFTFVKPYLIYDTVLVTGTLVMEPGARLYFHQGASLIAEGSVLIGNPYSSTTRQPVSSRILCISDRLDNLFDSVPYAYTAGGWDGLYIRHKQGGADEYRIDGLDVISAVNGIQLVNEDSCNLTPVTCDLSNSRIHNELVNGLTIHNIDAEVTNTEISNCGNYCVYLTGGKHTFVHSTIASFFNSTNVRIQSTSNIGKGAVFVDNADSLPKVTAEFINCVITGLGTQNLCWADTIKEDYEGRIYGNYLKCDSLPIPAQRALLQPKGRYSSTPNVYWTPEDTAQVFANTYFEYKKYNYYDFHLAEHSPARGIADPVTAALYPADRDGLPRPASQACAGCYEK